VRYIPISDLFFLFTSGNACVTTFALGALGPSTFALGWWDSSLAILFFDILGSLGPARLITLGPKTGLRCMTLYAFGLIPGGFLAFVNVLTCIGWSMVITMAGAEVFYALTDLKLPLAVCILILAIGYTQLPSPLMLDLLSSVSSDTSGFTFANATRDWPCTPSSPSLQVSVHLTCKTCPLLPEKLRWPMSCHSGPLVSVMPSPGVLSLLITLST
jgi:hypothetical protein